MLQFLDRSSEFDVARKGDWNSEISHDLAYCKITPLGHGAVAN